MEFSIAQGWKWISNKYAVSLCERLNMPPQCRLFLLSDGSLTNFLETLNRFPVDVKIKDIKTRRLQKEEAIFLDVGASQDSIIRDVWLTQDKRKLVYARSVFPLEGLDKDFLNKLSASIEPLGKNLTDQLFLTCKDKLEICAVHCAEINNILKISPDAILWAKHYRLTARPAVEGRCIKASITEIFSPELVGSYTSLPIHSGK